MEDLPKSIRWVCVTIPMKHESSRIFHLMHSPKNRAEVTRKLGGDGEFNVVNNDRGGEWATRRGGVCVALLLRIFLVSFSSPSLTTLITTIASGEILWGMAPA